VSCLPDAKGVHAWHVEARGVCNPTVAEPHREFSAKGCAIKLNKGGEAESLPLVLTFCINSTRVEFEYRRYIFHFFLNCGSQKKEGLADGC
jgi:hypothetical protein